MRERLQLQVRPRYFVNVEERVYVCEPHDPAIGVILPDVSITLREGVGAASGRPTHGTAAAAPAILEMIMEDVEVKERRLTVHRTSDRSLVTVIELLSPANKVAGSKGLRNYLEKRSAVLHSLVHLIEIDLLRRGLRFPSVSPLPPGQYYIHVSRESMRPKGEVWAVSLREPLPSIPVPLAGNDVDATLDLGQVLRHVYDAAGYSLLLDYAGPPPAPPLADEDAVWVDAMIRAAGRRQ
jgi:hypothetical protein